MIRFFRQYIRDRFFNRILLTYTCIIACSLVAVSLTILHSLTASLNKDAVSVNEQVVQDVENYVAFKKDKATSIVQRLYLELDPNFSTSEGTSGVFRYLSGDDADYSDNYYANLRAVNKFLKAGSLVDRDITDIMLLRLDDMTPRYSTIRNAMASTSLNPAIQKLPDLIAPDFYGIKLVPPTPLFLNEVNLLNHEVFSFAAIIRSTNLSKNIGLLLINFSNKSIVGSYDGNDRKLVPTVFLLTEQGKMVFDSSGSYYDKPFPDSNLYRKTLSSVPMNLSTASYLFNMTEDKEVGYRIASIISQTEINGSISPLRNTIIAVLVICLFLAILLAVLFMNVFSRRIKIIIKAMGAIKKGDLTTRIRSTDGRDEINLIANQFNMMCDNLEDYISQVYLSDLKQKDAELKQRTAELYALQSQINPHFLYNALESIRMRAISAGNDEVGRMIRILATLFRNSIKQDMIITVREELAHCNNYLDLFSIRYGDRLTVSFEIDPAIMDYGIMKHLLQPLIENFIVHGIDMDRANSIRVVGAKIDEEILIEIIDDGIGIPEERLAFIKANLASEHGTEKKNNIGILNVHQRIRLFFGSLYGVEIQSAQDQGTSVKIRMPAKTKGELLQNVQSHVG